MRNTRLLYCPYDHRVTRFIHQGPARVFDREEDAMQAVIEGKINAGDVVVSALGELPVQERKFAGRHGAYALSWSPDGRRIGFVCRNALWVIPVP